jgi:hypothetical protein
MRRRSLAAATVSLLALADGGSGMSAAERRDLGRDERRGGHTLARHVGLSDDQLRDRLRREKGIAAASTFTDRATAEEVVGEALARSRDRVRAWARRSGTRPNLTLDYRGVPGRAIGRSLRRGKNRVEPCIDAVVVLKVHWPEDEYFVLTAYPEVRR